jgi:hypothetical protein
MATSSRQTSLFGTQDWKRIYQTYREADFQSYDYETLRKSFIDYLTAYYPETFNDYIESSEFVALLDVMAFMGQALAFRDDLNTRENFIDTAERRDSVIKLANLVSYNPKRNTAGQGIVKVVAISTSENITDLNGVNLSNQTVLWNDAANASWQEQFNTVLNAALVNSQRIGRPGNEQNILGIKTEEYTINIPGGQLPTIPFITDVDGSTMNFELTSSTSANEDYLYEPPPAPSGQFNILYRNDKLGYGSPNTGFFFYFKQGSLQAYDMFFPERIENNLRNVDIDGINNTDTWLYQLNDAGNISSRWNQVDNIFVNNNSQGQSVSKIFAVTSRANDQVRYVFGDGVFGEIPVGAFRAYVRSGNSLTYTIDPSEMSGITIAMTYISRSNRTETLTFTFSLQSSTSTAQNRESISAIKERAPARYYTQNRMVNGEDYTNFPFTLYNSIVKSKALNRTSIGVSRNLDLLDPTGKYSSVNVFADDGALFVDPIDKSTTFSTININIPTEFLSQTLPVLLSSTAALQYYQNFYARYTGNYPGAESIDDRCYWQQTTLDGSTVTGYFYVKTTANTIESIPLGSFSSYTMRYITKGAQLNFVAPPGQYFDSDNRLQSGTPNPNLGDRTSIWIGVQGVVGDGYNFGQGNLPNGSGPVTLNSYVPTGAFLNTNTVNPTAIIPEFDNTLSNIVIRECLDRIVLKQDFVLKFDNSQLAISARWSLVQPVPVNPTPTDYFVSFLYNSFDDTYVVRVKNTTYYFSSVDQVRFVFDGTNKVFDSKTGVVLSDFVNVLRSNSNPTNTATLGLDYVLNVTGQQVESDGYPNDYQVSVSAIDPNTDFSFDPDFFTDIIGISTNAYVFFRLLTDIDDAYKTQLLPNGAVIFAYPTRNQVLTVLYEYPAGTLFYCKNGDNVTTTPRFYQSVQTPGTNPPILTLNDVTNSYLVATGRGALNFQYRHNSNNTTRIDPSTTNIIDLYLVTQSYYTQYQNWLRDTTGTVPLPPKPTINELQQDYGDLDSYKMISDSIVLNSVDFKPLFGLKAAPALQATIKVIKSPTTTVSDSQIRSSVLAALNSYFTIDNWDFGDTFFFSELTAYLHLQLGTLISSVVLVSNNPNVSFGDMYEVRSGPSEIFVNGATASDITVISALTPAALQRGIIS